MASIGILVVATDTVDDVQSDGENERAEQSMTELDSEFQTVADSENPQSVDLSMDSSGSTKIDDDSGWVNVSFGNDNVNSTLQAIEHTTPDGTTITYEGGAVWRGSGNETQTVSSPSAEFVNNSRERTVYLPLTTLNADGIENADSLSISSNETSDGYSEWIEGTVTIEIQSEYHAGWADYYESIAERVDGVEVNDDGSNGDPVNVTFGEGEFDDVDDDADDGEGSDDDDEGDDGSDEDEDLETIHDPDYFDDAFTADGDFRYLGASEMKLDGNLSSSGEVDTSSIGGAITDFFSFIFGGDTDSNIQENQDFTRMNHDEVIGNLLEEGRAGEFEERPLCKEEGDSVMFPSYDCTIDEPGTYYIDDWNHEDTVQIDVEEGDINLIVDDDVTFTSLSSGDSLQVQNADGEHSANIFTEDDIRFMGNNNVCVTQCEGADGGLFGGLFDIFSDVVSSLDVLNIFDSSPEGDELDAQGLQMYGTSETSINFLGSTNVEGVISTPPGEESNLLDLALEDNGVGFVSIWGAMDTGPVDYVGDLGIVQDPSLEDDYDPPEVYEPPADDDDDEDEEPEDESSDDESPDHDAIYVNIVEQQLDLTDD